MSLSKDSPPSLISLHLINATFTNCVFRNTNHPNLLGLESWLEFPFAKFEYDATFPLMMLRENFHFHFHNRPLSCITLMPGCGLLWHASRWSWLGQVTLLICQSARLFYMRSRTCTRRTVRLSDRSTTVWFCLCAIKQKVETRIKEMFCFLAVHYPNCLPKQLTRVVSLENYKQLSFLSLLKVF